MVLTSGMMRKFQQQGFVWQTFAVNAKKPNLCNLLIRLRNWALQNPGGEGGIRTRGRILSYTRFPGVRLKPLIHLSRRGRILAEALSINKCQLFGLFDFPGCLGDRSADWPFASGGAVRPTKKRGRIGDKISRDFRGLHRRDSTSARAVLAGDTTPDPLVQTINLTTESLK